MSFEDCENKIICGDCLKVLPKLPEAKMIFADPPDNLGVKYEGFTDKWQSLAAYRRFLYSTLIWGLDRSMIFWLSVNYRYLFYIISKCNPILQKKMRLFLWRYTFGQHNNRDCGSGFRPLLRFWIAGQIYPDAIRAPSARQTKYDDKRANSEGRIPDDVWEFSRVCGTFGEKRRWHPNQHPEALIERIVKFSCKPGDLVIDMFAGTGTVNRVCKKLDIDCIGIEISRFYCEQIAKELSISVE